MANLVGPIQHKRGTTVQWASSTVPLRDGEIGIDTTLRRMKVGDGGTLFPDLGWASTDQVTLDRIEAVAASIDDAVSVSDAVMATVQADPSSAFAVAQKATIGAAVPSVVAAVAVPVGQSRAVFTRWKRQFRRDPSALYYLEEGDSTEDWAGTGTGAPSAARVARLAGLSILGTQIPARFHTAPGEGLFGMVSDLDHFLNAGNSGMRLASFLADYDAGVTTPKSLRWSLAQMDGKAGVVEHRWGINDLREQVRTVDQLRTDLIRLIDIWRAAQPQLEHILIVPNSLLADNVGNANYVRDSPTGTINPAGLAQTISERFRAAYLPLVDRWPDVTVVDSQTTVYGTKAIAYNGNGFMADQLHPNVRGQQAEIDWIVENLLGIYDRKAVMAGRFGTAPVALSPYAPWTVNPAVLDDTDQFVRVAVGDTSSDTVAGARNTFSYPQFSDIAPYDIVRMPDGTVYQIPQNGTTTQSGLNTRINSTAAVANQPGKLEVFRQIRTGDSTMDAAVLAKGNRFRKFFRVVSATTTSVTLRPVSVSNDRETTTAAELAALIIAGNALYLAGAGGSPITLTAGQASASGVNVVVTGLSTDYTAYVGRMAAVIGTQSSSAPGPAGAPGAAGGIGSPVAASRDIVPLVFGALTAAAGSNGNEYAVPILPLQALTVGQLSIEVVTAVAGATARLGIRAANGAIPGTLLVDGGVVDCSTTGLKSVTASTTIAAGTLVWLVVSLAGTAAANLKTINGICPFVTLRSGVAGELGAASFLAARSTTDAALSTNWGSGATPSNWAPLVRLTPA